MTRRLSMLLVGALVVAGLVMLALFLIPGSEERQAEAFTPGEAPLLREHSPVIGPENAPVTIVEFFDPSCEACRAMYPLVKQVLAEHPQDVRLVLRYALFHQGSEEVVRMLEAARRQDVYQPVLEAVLATLPLWHNDPNVRQAWAAAEAAGLDVPKAREQMHDPTIDAILATDMRDLREIGIRGTPTFYINGTQLERLGEQPLRELVQREIEKAR